MKIKYLIGLALIWLLTAGFSFKIDLMGYAISYETEEEQEVIDNLPEQPSSQIYDFDKDINNLNSIAEVQQALLSLGYSRIGFTDTDTSTRYVILISDEGLITSTYAGDNIPADVELRGSMERIRDYAMRQDYERLRLAVEMPFSLKLKLFLYSWFN